MKKYLITLCLLLIFMTGKSQYLPQFSQLIKTLEFVNPGYNASKADPSATMLYRNQWTGFTGAPKMYGLNLNVPVNKWHTGFGTNILVESRGLTIQNNVALNANVDVKISESSYLTFGLNGGIETKRIDLGRADPYEELLLTADDLNSNNLYTAIGLNLFTKELHLGAAFHYTMLEGKNYAQNEYYTIYLNGSYLLNLSDDWILKPTLMYRHFAGYNDLDLGIFALYKDVVWAGFAYRINNAVIFFADVKVAKFLRMGYSYDLSVGNMRNYSPGSHELSLEIILPRNIRQFERTIN